LANGFTLFLLGITQIWLMDRDYFVKQFAVPDPIRILLLAYFIFIVGMVAARNKDKLLQIVARIKYILIITGAYMVYYIFEEGITRYFKTYNIEAFYSQWRPDVLFYTLILSAVLFYAFNRSHLQFKIIERLSKLSFSVFFIHVIILEEVWKGFGLKLFNLTTPNSFGKIIFDPLFFLSVAIISFFVCYIIRKVPLLPKLTG
jgi:peptidoglycan/LPS O-acetylase OafA/YrhL